MTSATATMTPVWKDDATPAIRRGECPTLGKPMLTGDGLLARLRPLDCRLTVDQFQALAAAAHAYGNGLLEITARGSIQIRGLVAETVRPLEEAVFAARIDIPEGPAVETGPLSGLDPEELQDMRPLAAELRRAIAQEKPALVLAPKLAITFDGGGQAGLGAILADIRVEAFRASGGQIRFQMSLGGDRMNARPLAIVEENNLIEAVMVTLRTLALSGPAARGRDLDLAALAERLPAHELPYSPEKRSSDARSAGVLDLEQSHSAIGLTLPYGQIDGEGLTACLAGLQSLGASEIRLSPGHGFFALVPQEKATDAVTWGEAHGFWTNPGEARSAIALCAGARGCASGNYDTRLVAEKVVECAPILLDGSITVHLSGCAKGCAHPARAGLVFSGAPTGYGLVVNGAASEPPALYIPASQLESGLEALASLVKQTKEAGETVRECLLRLGPRRVAEGATLEDR